MNISETMNISSKKKMEKKKKRKKAKIKKENDFIPARVLGNNQNLKLLPFLEDIKRQEFQQIHFKRKTQ